MPLNESLHSNAAAFVDTSRVENEDIVIFVNGTGYRICCWKPGMPVPSGSLVIDTETELIVPGLPTHPVLLQVQSVDERYVWYVPFQHIEAFLTGMREAYRAGKVDRIIMHNCAFDTNILGMLNRYFFPEFHDFWVDTVLDDKLEDIGLRFLLQSLADGSYTGAWSLDHISGRYLNLSMGKAKKSKAAPEEEPVDSDEEDIRDTRDISDIRLGFRRDSVLTREEVIYACRDVIHTSLIWKLRPRQLPTEDVQIMGLIALSEISRNGMKVDVEHLRVKREEYTRELVEHTAALQLFGYFKGRNGNQQVLQDILRNIEERTGIALPRCDRRVLKDGTVKEDIRSGKVLMEVLETAFDKRQHPFCTALLKADHAGKMLSTYLNESYIGADGRVHPRFSPIVRTGRTSCSNPNLQNPPRKGGIREMYVPEPGWVFFANDYSQAELCTLAQTCYARFGFSTMLEVINSGEDLHMWFGRKIAEMEGRVWDDLSADEKKQYRQMAKACYSADTELLTKEGWKRIDELYGTDAAIAQYCPHTKEISFVESLSWTKLDDRELIRFVNDMTDVMVTPEHRMLRVSRAGVVSEIQAKDLGSNEQFSQVHGGFYKSEPLLSPELTRLAVMVQADGSFNGNRCRVGVSKARKKTRCAAVLSGAGVPYTRTSQNGVDCFRFPREALKGVLTDDKHFLNWTMYDPEAFIDELHRWDGSVHTQCRHTRSYFNTHKGDVDTAQSILVTSGYKSSTHPCEAKDDKRLRGYRLNWYAGDFKKNPAYGRTSGLVSRTQEGRHTVYCPTVPTSWVLTRRNGNVLVSGNCNFGFPGGLSPRTLQVFAKQTYNVLLELEQCAGLKLLWLGAFPEMEMHLRPQEQPKTGRFARRRKDEEDEEKQLYVAYTLNGRKRSGCSYNSACNNPFQGLAADGAKIAMFMCAVECWTSTPRCRMVNFVHDEVIFELEETEGYMAVCKRLSEHMLNGMQSVVPDVMIRDEGVLMRRWSKVDPQFDSDGNLTPWEPE